MIKKFSFLLFFVYFLCLSPLVPRLYADTQADITQQEQMRKAYTYYKSNYKDFRDTRKKIELSEEYAEASEMAEYYHDMGKKLEDQGRLKEAEIFYKRAYKTISRNAPTRYIWKTNAKFKSNAKIYRSRAKSTLRKHKKILEKIEKKRNSAISKLQKWIAIRERKNNNKVPEEKEKTLNKITSFMDNADALYEKGDMKKARSYYKKAFNLSHNIDRKKEILDHIDNTFETEMNKETALIENAQTLNLSGDHFYKYEAYEDAYTEYTKAYDLLLNPEKQPKPVSMKMPSLP